MNEWLRGLRPKNVRNHQASIRAVRQERYAAYDDLGDIEVNKRKSALLRQNASRGNAAR